jgi:hypothetical protein
VVQNIEPTRTGGCRIGLTGVPTPFESILPCPCPCSGKKYIGKCSGSVRRIGGSVRKGSDLVRRWGGSVGKGSGLVRRCNGSVGKGGGSVRRCGGSV